MSETIRFYLNLQMVADEMQSQFPEGILLPGEDGCCLRGACFYQKGMPPEKQYVYLVKGEDLEGETVPQVHCSLIVLGKIPQKLRQSLVGFKRHAIFKKARRNL